MQGQEEGGIVYSEAELRSRRAALDQHIKSLGETRYDEVERVAKRVIPNLSPHTYKGLTREFPWFLELPAVAHRFQDALSLYPALWERVCGPLASWAGFSTVGYANYADYEATVLPLIQARFVDELLRRVDTVPGLQHIQGIDEDLRILGAERMRLTKAIERLN